MKTYPYAKLRKAAKAKALEDWVQQDNWDWFDDDVVKDDFRERGKERGFEIDNIYWSGFWSQGDGASWEGDIRIAQWCAWQRKLHEEKGEAPPANLAVLEVLAQGEAIDRFMQVRCDGRSNHEMSMSVPYDIEFSGFGCVINDGGMFQDAECETLWDARPEGLEDRLLEDARAYAKEFYKALEEEYEHQTSEEHFAELCKANDWTFTASGRFVRN